MFYVIIKRTVQRSCLNRNINYFSADYIFNEETIRQTVEKFAKLKPIGRQPHIPTKEAAVLVPLCIVDGKVSLLYTLRAANLKKHRGQVSFPGGMKDDSDADLQETAIRETEEELGLNKKDIIVWGQGTKIITRQDTCVTPILGRIATDNLIIEQLPVNTSEVEDVFTVSLEKLCDPKYFGHTQFKNAYSTPTYFGGKIRVWGLTAIITNLFLSSLLPRDIFRHRVIYLPPVKSKKSAISTKDDKNCTVL